MKHASLTIPLAVVFGIVLILTAWTNSSNDHGETGKRTSLRINDVELEVVYDDDRVDDEDKDSGEVLSRRRRAAGTPIPFTAEERQNIVDLHNDYRRQVSPEAANMEFMTWDDQLTTWAQEWAETCYYEHGFPESASHLFIGQNLWRGWVFSEPDGTGPLASWWNEWQWYTYENNSCLPDKICGHYTQLVWGPSSQVGCGRTFCAEGYDDTLNFTDNYIIACNYLEHGNVVGSQPYTTGPSCTKCASGVGECDDKLCRQCQPSETSEECSTTCKAVCHNCATMNTNCTCTCPPEFTGVDCSVPCGDYDDNCGDAWPDYACFWEDFEFIPEICPALCGLCTPDDGSFVCETITGVTTSASSLTTSTSVPLTTFSTTNELIPTTSSSSSSPSSSLSSPSSSSSSSPTSSSTSPSTQAASISTTVPSATVSSTTVSSTTGMSTSESADPTTPSCSLTLCQNGGTFDQDKCICQCAEEYQGISCAVPKNEIINAVLITLDMDISNWAQVLPALRAVIAEITTDYCNTNFAQCCPNQGVKTSNAELAYVSHADVGVVGGYPKTQAGGQATQVALYVQPPSVTAWCEEGSNAIFRPAMSEFLPQATLLAAITEHIGTIEDQLDVDVDDVQLGELDDGSDVGWSGLTAGWIVGICLMTTVPFTIAVAAGGILKLKSLHMQNLWNRQNFETKVRPSERQFSGKRQLGNKEVFALEELQ